MPKFGYNIDIIKKGEKTMLMCEYEPMEYAVVNEEVEVDEDFFDYEPDVDECGFNPYMGCYDFDC